jgi:hypothetical protein
MIMKKPILSFLVFLFTIAVRAYSLDLSIEGNASSAPIYTLDGTGTSDLLIDKYSNNDGVHVHQEFIYSMANVNSGNVSCIGTCRITSIDPGYEWDVSFSGSSNYQIKSYGNLAVVSFNHKLLKTDSSLALIRATWCNGGYITSSGKSYVTEDSSGGFYLMGMMSGKVIGTKDKYILTNIKYKSPFTQTFDLSVSQDWASWLGEFTFSSNSKGGVTGDGILTFGDANDPVDTVSQTVKGTFSKLGVYSWTTTSKSKADSKVKVTIRNTASDVIDGKNNITAAAQSRKF